MKEGKKVKPNEESEENEEDLSSYEEEQHEEDEEIPDDGITFDNFRLVHQRTLIN